MTPDQLHAKLNSEVDRVRADRAFTLQAKRVLLARAYRDARRQMDAARAQTLASREQERARLTRELFSVAGLLGNIATTETRVGVAVSLRDAQDRAARLADEQEALDLLARAERSGDEVLARAVVERSLEQLWLAPLNAYAEAHPGTEPKLQRLVDLAPVGGLRDDLGVQMQYALHVPVELTGLSDRDLDALAQQQITAGVPIGLIPQPATVAASGGTPA